VEFILVLGCVLGFCFVFLLNFVFFIFAASPNAENDTTAAEKEAEQQRKQNV